MRLPLDPGPPPATAQAALLAWGLMGRKLVWEAVPIVVDMLGITDPETLIAQLAELRDSQEAD